MVSFRRPFSLYCCLFFVACSNNKLLVQADEDDTVCGLCTEYGGFRDPSALSALVVPCNMMWLATAPLAFFVDTCEAIDSTLTAHSCCNEAPIPDCPICGDGASLPNPDRLVPGSDFTCRNLQALLAFSFSDATFSDDDPFNDDPIADDDPFDDDPFDDDPVDDAGFDDDDDFADDDGFGDCPALQASTAARLCCQAEEPTEDQFCATCPGGVAKSAISTADDDFCYTVVLRQLDEDPTDCPDMTDLGCCSDAFQPCSNPETVCEDPTTYRPDRLLEFTNDIFMDEKPTCADFMKALDVLDPENCTTAFLGIDPQGLCCKGSAECFVCLEGGEVAEPDRPLSFFLEEATCGNINGFINGFDAEDCTAELLEIELDGYCGCPNATMMTEPPSLCSMCGGEPVPDASFVIPTGESCGELEFAAPWLTSAERCDSFIPTWDAECCNRTAVTAMPTDAPSMDVSSAAVHVRTGLWLGALTVVIGLLF